MRVIFLDIDGVLNHKHTLNHNPISKGAAARLRYLVKATGAEVVLISSWRKIESSVKAFIRKTKIRPIGMTDSSWHGVRGVEIRDYLEAHPEIERYVILEDETDLLEEHRKHLVKCEMRQGFTQDKLNDAVLVLLGLLPLKPFRGNLYGDIYYWEKVDAKLKRESNEACFFV